MGRENVEIVRGLYARLSDRGAEGTLDALHPDFVFDWSESRAPWRGIYRGHEGMRRLWSEQHEVWEGFTLEIVEALEIDPEHVLTVTAVRGRGEGSGIDMGATGYMLWTIVDGTIVSGKLFQSKEEALEAAGASVQEAQD
jgi:ketosteroid isomerase-like protein